MTLAAIIARYGLLAILLGAGIEGETVVLTGGLLAHERLLPLPGVMAAAAIGSFLADQFFFLLGRRFRDHRRVQWIIAKPAFARALAMLERHPTSFILAFRFLYGLRTVSPIAIGTTQVPVRTFVLLNGAAAIVWGIAIAAVGYGFGGGIRLVFGRLQGIEHIALAAAIILAGLLLIVWFVRRCQARNVTAAD